MFLISCMDDSQPVWNNWLVQFSASRIGLTRVKFVAKSTFNTFRFCMDSMWNCLGWDHKHHLFPIHKISDECLIGGRLTVGTPTDHENDCRFNHMGFLGPPFLWSWGSSDQTPHWWYLSPVWWVGDKCCLWSNPFNWLQRLSLTSNFSLKEIVVSICSGLLPINQSKEPLLIVALAVATRHEDVAYILIFYMGCFWVQNWPLEEQQSKNDWCASNQHYPIATLFLRYVMEECNFLYFWIFCFVEMMAKCNYLCVAIRCYVIIEHWTRPSGTDVGPFSINTSPPLTFLFVYVLTT